MSKSLSKFLLLFAFLWACRLSAQDIPLFTQKLTNSFIYNPALAGNNFGSITFAHRSNYSGVKDGPKSTFLSAHTPFANYRFGTGINIFQEDVGVFRSTYASAAFAYHVHFNKFSILSLGLSGEFDTFRLNGSQNVSGDIGISDPVYNRLQAGKTNDKDFSFGANYQNQFLKVGFSANRLSNAFFKEDTLRALSSFYSGYAQGIIRLRDRQDLLEPYIAYRKFSASNSTYDIGLYYTYSNKITAGAGTRRGSVMNFTLAYRLSKYLLVGYSREMILGSIGGFVGSSNEFVLRFDFADQGMQQKFKADYKSALSYRRKTLNNSSVKKTVGGRTPKQLNKAQKRVAAFSPNARYQNTSKLSGGKKTYKPASGKKKGSPQKRKKPSSYKKKRR